MFWAYRFYFYQNKKIEKDVFNERAWLQGAYIYEAVSVALANSLGGAKIDYRSEPYDLYHEKTLEKVQKQRDAMEEQIKARAMKVGEMLGGNKE